MRYQRRHHNTSRFRIVREIYSLRRESLVVLDNQSRPVINPSQFKGSPGRVASRLPCCVNKRAHNEKAFDSVVTTGPYFEAGQKFQCQKNGHFVFFAYRYARQTTMLHRCQTAVGKGSPSPRGGWLTGSQSRKATKTTARRRRGRTSRDFA